MKLVLYCCLILTLTNLNDRLTTAMVIQNDNNSDITLFADGRNIALRQSKDSASWLQMVLVFAKKQTDNLIDCITTIITPADCDNITTAKPICTTPTSTTPTSTSPTSTTPTSTAPTSTTPKPLRCQTSFIKLGSQCYFFSTTTSNWANALTTCRRLNSDLAHPRNKEENSLIVNYLQTTLKTTESWWIGGNDLSKEGTWVWSRDNSNINFTDWIAGQPSDTGGNEDCLHYLMSQGSVKWNDVACSTATFSICQQNPETV